MESEIGAKDTAGEMVFVRRLLIALAILGVALFFYVSLHVLLLIFGAVLLALLFRSLADVIERHTGLSEGWSLALAILAIFLALGLTLFLFGAQIGGQVGTLAQDLPKAWGELQRRLEGVPWIADALRQGEPSADPSTRSVVGRLGSAFYTALGALADFILVLFGGLFLALQPEIYRRGILHLVPLSERPRAAEVLARVGLALRQWLTGQLLSMGIVGVLVTLGLLVLGVPSAVALGLLAAILEFVPYIGPIASAVPAMLVAMTVDPTAALWVAALFVAIQQIEGYVVYPLVQREMVDIPPALTIFSIVAFGLAFGWLGIIFAMPLTVVAFVVVRELYVRDTLDDPVPRAEDEKR